MMSLEFVLNFIKEIENEFIDNYFTINHKKNSLFLKYGENKIVIKCDKEDKFDWVVGLGLAISNLDLIDKEKAKRHRENFRNKKTRKLDYKKYGYWVIIEYFNNDLIKIKELENQVKENEGKLFRIKI